MSAIKHNVGDLVWRGPGGTIEILSMSTHQAISELYVITLHIKSEDANLDFGALLNGEVEIVLKAGERLEDERVFSGIITQLSQQRTRHGNLPNASGKNYLYHVEIRPKFWLLTRQFRSRVYQQKNVKDIVSEVLGEHGVQAKWDLKGAPPVLEYCLQYEETDYHFISRLLEDEGICFFFDQKEKKVFFTDHSGGHLDCSPTAEAQYVEEVSPRFQFGPHEFIRDFNYEESIGTGKHVINHYNYETSQTNIKADEQENKVPLFSNFEVYEHSKNYVDRDQGKRYALLRKEEQVAHAKRGHGLTSCRSFEAGHVMQLTKHFRDKLNGKWLLTSCTITAEQGNYTCRFQALPADIPFRPKRKTPKPKVNSIQTATVTGPSGAKVYLDELGRCKCQFHWDREGGKDDRVSMWIRVSNNYAGKGYGIQWIPRVGDEVLVSFVNGDPDQPIATGRVYNSHNTPPLGPANKWQNIIKTIKDNHILFDDEDNKELIKIRAQKDMLTEVINNKTVIVGNDETKSINNNATEYVKKNKIVEVDEEDYSEKIGRDRITEIGKNHCLNIGKTFSKEIGKDYTVKVDGSCSIEVKKAVEVKAKIGEVKISSPTQLTLAVGSSKVELSPAGISLEFGGSSIKLNAAGVSINGVLVTIN